MSLPPSLLNLPVLPVLLIPLTSTNQTLPVQWEGGTGLAVHAQAERAMR